MIDLHPDAGQIRFLKVRDAGGVINATVELLRRNAREVFIAFFALVVPFALISGIGSALYIRSVGDLFSPDAMIGEDFDVFSDLFSPAYFVSVLVGWLGTAVASAVGAAYVRLYRQGHSGEITPGLLWDEAKGLVLPTIGFYFAYIGVLIGTGLVNIIPCLGQIAWVAFIVWSLPYATVTWTSRMIEADRLGEAVRRANLLVKGSWGFSIGTILLSWLLVIIALMAISLPLQFAAGGLSTATGNETLTLGVLSVIAIPQQILTYAAYLIPTIAGFFVHGRLAAELDGVHLDEEIDLLERGVDAGPESAWSDAPAPFSDETITDATRPADDAPEAGGDDTRDEPPAPGGFRGGGFGT